MNVEFFKEMDDYVIYFKVVDDTRMQTCLFWSILCILISTNSFKKYYKHG